MLRIIAQAALLAGVLALGACGFADSRAPVPEFMRIKEAEQAPPESPPDVKRVVREQIEFVFLSTSNPREVHVATPHREVRGPGWTACVRAQLTSATGSALGAQTYIVTITGGKVVDRRRAEADDICGSESYEPI
jgi:SH3-like domain-containing protein